MPTPHAVKSRLFRSKVFFKREFLRLYFYNSKPILSVQPLKRKAYRGRRRKKMYRRRFFKHLRRKWLTGLRGLLAINRMSGTVHGVSSAASAHGRQFADFSGGFTTQPSPTPGARPLRSWLDNTNECPTAFEFESEA